MRRLKSQRARFVHYRIPRPSGRKVFGEILHKRLHHPRAVIAPQDGFLFRSPRTPGGLSLRLLKFRDYQVFHADYFRSIRSRFA